MSTRHARRVSVFGVIGAGVFVLGQLLLVLFVAGFHLDAAVANAAQLIITLLASFVLNAKFTWQDRDFRSHAVVRFAASRIATGMIAYLLFLTFHVTAGVHYMLANALSVLAATGLNYLAGDLWVFRGKDGCEGLVG